MADFVRDKNQRDAFFRICTIFGRFMAYVLVVISYEKYVDFYH